MMNAFSIKHAIYSILQYSFFFLGQFSPIQKASEKTRNHSANGYENRGWIEFRSTQNCLENLFRAYN